MTIPRPSRSERVRRLLAGDEPLRRTLALPGDAGLFGPDSVTWEVHAGASMVVGGLRALLLQSMHPKVAAAVADHSRYRQDPFGRLASTVRFVGLTTYGTTADVDVIVGRVRDVHDHITGTTPAGEPYEANDPHLLAWVHATEVESFAVAHHHLTGRRSRSELDAYVEEMAELALAVGVEDPPRSWWELQATIESYRAELAVGDQGRDVTRFLLWPKIPHAMRPAYTCVAAGAVEMLPPWARRSLGVPSVPGSWMIRRGLVRPAAAVAVRAGTTLIGTGHIAAARQRCVEHAADAPAAVAQTTDG